MPQSRAPRKTPEPKTPDEGNGDGTEKEAGKSDFLSNIEKEMRARMTELEPLVNEYKRLEAAERALSAVTPPNPPGRPRSRK